MALRQFGELEAVIMDRLWRYGHPVPVREVVEDLQKDRAIAYTTVLTVMDKLQKKGWLRREKAGRGHVYEPLVSRETYTARLMRSALATSDNQAAAFVHFLSELSDEEARALRAAMQIISPKNDS
jgi:predicted transcriptional regulator